MDPRWVVLGLVAACSGTKTGAQDSAKPGSPAARAKAASKEPCIAPPDTGGGIRRAHAAGSRVEFCVGKDPGTRSDEPIDCFAIDVVNSKLERLVQPPEVLPPGTARVESAEPRLDICTGESCTSLTPKVLPGAAGLRAATNPAGTVAVVLLGDTAKGKGYAEVWDVPKGKKTATFKYARGDFRCGEVAMLGDKTIYVNATQCGQPAARAGLYRLDGRKIANVGGKDFGTYGRAFVLVDDTTWAFLEESATQLVLQDIATGKVTKTIDITALAKSNGADMANPGESAVVRLGDGRLAVISGSPATGSLAVVDPANGAVTVIPAPLCKAP